jgi:predicted transglutaminase-like cysteine proteinase
MLLRIAAWCSAAFLAAVPASASIETGAVADTHASATARAIAAPYGATMAQATTPQPDLAAKIEDAADKPTEQSPQPPTALGVIRQAPLDTAAQSALPRQDTRDIGAAAKLAALEAPAKNPATVLVAPQPEASVPDLPHIDASIRFSVLPVKSGGVLMKWNAVKAALQTESEIFARCRAKMDACPTAAKKFLAIVDQGRALTGRARIGVINRAVNLAITPMSDLAQWGVPDRWSPPLETFTTGKGDCEDYAIAKYAALMQTGIAPEDVKLMIIRNTAANEDHAVAAVRLAGSWIILDNRWLKLVDDTAMPQAVPLFALGLEGVQQFLPDVLIGAAPARPAPATIAD